MFDIVSDFQMTRGANQTLSGTVANNSALIDLKGWEALSVYLATATVTDAGAATGFTMKLQHSDTTVGADFVDVPAALTYARGAVSVVEDTDDNKVLGAIAYLGDKRYVRAVFTGTAGTDAVVYILAMRGRSSSISRPVPAVGATTAAT